MLDNFLRYFEEHPIINLTTERIKLNLLFKLSNLNSNFALTLGYLNPALNNPAQVVERVEISLVEIYDGVGKSDISVCKRIKKLTDARYILWM